jgi:hypothetical protein
MSHRPLQVPFGTSEAGQTNPEGTVLCKTSDTLAWLSTPRCGLVGPHAFTFQWTFQRRRDGRHSTRETAHHHYPQMKGQALFVEAAAPPIKRIRHAALELVDSVWELIFVSGAIDPSILISLGTSAHWDLHSPLLQQQWPREGSRMVITRARTQFASRYAGWQTLALRNGRFFPPPVRWELAVDVRGCVQILLGWSPDFLPDDQVFIVKRAVDVTSCTFVVPHQARKITEFREASWTGYLR